MRHGFHIYSFFFFSVLFFRRRSILTFTVANLTDLCRSICLLCFLSLAVENEAIRNELSPLNSQRHSLRQTYRVPSGGRHSSSFTLLLMKQPSRRVCSHSTRRRRLRMTFTPPRHHCLVLCIFRWLYTRTQRNSDLCDSGVWVLCTPSMLPLPSLEAHSLFVCPFRNGRGDVCAVLKKKSSNGLLQWRGTGVGKIMLCLCPRFVFPSRVEMNVQIPWKEAPHLAACVFYFFKPRWKPTKPSPTFILKESEFMIVIRPSACD